MSQHFHLHFSSTWHQHHQSLYIFLSTSTSFLDSKLIKQKQKEKKMAGNEDWRKRADTTKMSNEDIRAAGVEGSKRPPGQNPGGLLHQRRRLPVSTTTVIVAGTVLTFAVSYFVLYAKKKPEASAVDVAKVAIGTADTKDTHPRK